MQHEPILDDEEYLKAIMQEIDAAPCDQEEPKEKEGKEAPREAQSSSAKRPREPGVTLEYFTPGTEAFLSDVSSDDEPNAKRRKCGITMKEIATHTARLMQSAGDSEGLALFCAGLSEGRHVLSLRLLEDLELDRTRFLSFSKHGVGSDLFLQSVFELNGVPAVQFTWEEENVETSSKKFPYKTVAQFAIGVRVNWGLAEPSIWSTKEAKTQTRVTAISRAALSKGIPGESLLRILAFAEVQMTVPLALYWKGYRPRYRSEDRKYVASVRCYPPKWQSGHVVATTLEFVLRVLGLQTGAVPAEEFFTLLMCLVSNTAVLSTEGRWDLSGARVLYTPVEKLEDWAKC